jgi:DNA-binding MarR family transcriptional regulator
MATHDGATGLKSQACTPILLTLGSDTALTEGGLGVTRLATITGHEKSQVSRALAVLAEHGLVERSPGETDWDGSASRLPPVPVSLA